MRGEERKLKLVNEARMVATDNAMIEQAKALAERRKRPKTEKTTT